MTPASTVGRLRAEAVATALQPWPSATAMIRAVGFLQYDPITRPARAQDLVLAARVPGYRVGRLDREYPSSGLDEDDLHVYGVMSPEVRSMVHPRGTPGRPDDPPPAPVGVAAAVRAVVAELGEATARDVARRTDHGTRLNDWGGVSSATTLHLEELHHTGWLRVRARVGGTRVYETCAPPASGLAPPERLERLVLVLARLLAPVSHASLRKAVAQLQRNSGRLGDPAGAVSSLLASGLLRRDVTDGEEYLRPVADGDGDAPAPGDPPRRVRFLAPFDPLVWDRRRFAHLWGWEYRLEAYTPPARRRFGYYALPVLWGHRMVGWVNAEVRGGVLDLAPGYIGRAPAGASFARAFDAEAARLAAVLGVNPP